MNPGAVGLGYCEGLFTRTPTKRVIAEKYLGRHLLRIQQALEAGELKDAFWLPGTENPADGLTKARGDMGPLLGLLEIGRFYLDSCAPSQVRHGMSEWPM